MIVVIYTLAGVSACLITSIHTLNTLKTHSFTQERCELY